MLYAAKYNNNSSGGNNHNTKKEETLMILYSFTSVDCVLWWRRGITNLHTCIKISHSFHDTADPAHEKGQGYTDVEFRRPKLP